MQVIDILVKYYILNLLLLQTQNFKQSCLETRTMLGYVITLVKGWSNPFNKSKDFSKIYDLVFFLNKLRAEGLVKTST